MTAAHADHDPAPTCAWEGCQRPVRAKGHCDTHYRAQRRREAGIGGVEPMDGAVYKLRVARPTGNQPTYYSNREKAYEAAREAKAAGTLLFFSVYTEGMDLLDEV